MLQPFDEQRSITFRLEYVRVEVVSLDAFGVGEDDVSDAKCGDLRPEPPHHFWPRKGKEQVDARPGRNRRVKCAAQCHCIVGDRLHCRDTARAIEDAYANLISGRDPQDGQQVFGARARKRDVPFRASSVGVADFTGLEKNQIHVSQALHDATGHATGQ